MRFAAIIVVLILMLSATVSWAVEQAQPARFSLDLQGVEVAQALLMLSQKAQVTVLGDSTAKGKVTCSLNEVTAEQALGVICKMNKLVWVKAYANTGPEEKLNATKLFKLLDVLRELGGASLVCEDSKKENWTIFIPRAAQGSVDASTLASDFRLRPVYLVRAEPDPNAEKQKQMQNSSEGGLAALTPPADPTVAANQVWNYFTQMGPEQFARTVDNLARMLHQATPPDVRKMIIRALAGPQEAE